MESSSRIIYEGPFFTIIANGAEVGLSHLFFVKLKSAEDEIKLIELAAENNVTVVGYNEQKPLWYTLTCSGESAGNTLEMANMFYETGLFADARPDLMSDDQVGDADRINEVL
jgi:hypothetical protein